MMKLPFTLNDWLRTTSVALIFTIIFSPNLLFSQATVDTDQQPPVYNVNENIIFSFSGISGTTNSDIFYDKTDGAGPPYLDSKTVSNSINFTYSHPEAGVVLCDVNQGSPDANIKAALIDPFNIDPLITEPFSPTFESFWAGVIANIPNTSNPLYSTLTMPSNQPSASGYDAYDVSFEYESGKFISGFYMVPDDLASGEKVPTILRLPAYTSSASSNDGTFLTIAGQVRAIVLHLNAHPDGESTGYPSGAGDYVDRNTYHYKETVAGVIRAIDYIESQTTIHDGNLAVFGESQGGGLSLLVAGIDDRIDGVCISNPALCEHKGREVGKASGFPDYVKRGGDQGVPAATVVAEAKYYDAAISAKRIDVPCFAQIGYEDQTTPAATSISAVNQLRNAVHITHGFDHDHTHGFGGFYGDASVMFLQRVLNGVTTETSNSVKYYYADAGPTTLSANANVAVAFNGSISENEGTYSGGLLWESIEGPASPTISSPTSASTDITFPQNGVYVIRLSADPLFIPNSGNNDIFYTAFDYVTVTVGNNPTCNPTVNPGSLNPDENSGSTTISVSGISAGWSVGSSENWLTVNNSNNTDINVSYTANPNSNSRSAIITITCTNGVAAASIPVTQDGSGGGSCQLLTIDGSMFYNEDGTPATGSQHGNALGDEQTLIGDPVNGDFNNSVQTAWQYPWVADAKVYLALPQSYDLETIYLYEDWGTGDFSVALGLPSENNAPFATISTSEAPGYVHVIDFPANTQEQYITFTKITTSGKIREIALCGSFGGPSCNPTFSPTILNVTENSGSSTISVSGISAGWTVTSSENWLTVINSNDTDINASYTANTGSNSRTVTITLTCSNGAQASSYTVTQDGSNSTCNPTVNPGSLNPDENSGSTTISVSGISAGWSVGSSENWLTVNNSNDTDINVSYTANPNSNSRSANITITCTNGVAAASIPVTQDGTGGGSCQLLTIDGSMFYNEDGTPATGSQHGNALGDEQTLIGDPVNGDFNNSVQTAWQYPWVADAKVYLALPQSYDLETIYLYEDWGTGDFSVALGLPSENNAPFATISTSEAPGYVHVIDFPANTQEQYITFTKITTSGKIREIALCGSTGGGGPTCTPAFGTSNLNVSENSGSSTISVSGISAGWTVTSSENWLTVSNSNDTDINASYTANTGSNSRTATITLTCANGTQAGNTITLTQDGTTPPGSDIEVTVAPSADPITSTQTFTSSLKVKNTTGGTITGITVDCLNMNYNHSSGSSNAFTLENSGSIAPTHGSYNWWSAQWTLGTLNAGEEATLDFDFKIKSPSSCQPGILMEATATENSNDYDGSNTVDCNSSFTSSTSDDLILEQSISVYPNPASDQLQIVVNNPAFSEAKFTVRDQLGRQVLLSQNPIERGQNTYLLDISNLSVGVYFLYVETGSSEGKQQAVKFIKMKR